MSKKDIKEPIEQEVEPIEEVEKEPIEQEVVKEYTGDLRGFKSLKEAKEYPNTPEFKNLDIGCRTEYMTWLESI